MGAMHTVTICNITWYRNGSPEYSSKIVQNLQKMCLRKKPYGGQSKPQRLQYSFVPWQLPPLAPSGPDSMKKTADEMIAYYKASCVAKIDGFMTV